MAFDSEGNFTRLHNWDQDRLNDIGIVSDRHDEEDDNFTSALNVCFLRDGRVPLSGTLKMNGNQIKNLGAGTSSGDGVNKGQMENAVAYLKEEMIDLWNSNSTLGDIKASLQTANHGSWLLCDGQAVSRTTYADLFELIGINFGAGDGTTTFNVPDYRGKFLRGFGGNSAADVYTTQAEGLPKVPYSRYPQSYTRVFDPYASTGGNHAPGSFSFETAYATSDIYGASEHVTPINQAVNFFIKAKEEE